MHVHVYVWTEVMFHETWNENVEPRMSKFSSSGHANNALSFVYLDKRESRETWVGKSKNMSLSGFEKLIMFHYMLLLGDIIEMLNKKNTFRYES